MNINGYYSTNMNQSQKNVKSVFSPSYFGVFTVHYQQLNIRMLYDFVKTNVQYVEYENKTISEQPITIQYKSARGWVNECENQIVKNYVP